MRFTAAVRDMLRVVREDAPNPGREESDHERLDRNLLELLNELRVVLPGVQVLFAFLLAVPFNQRFDHVTNFQRDVYLATLLCTAMATIMLIAPTALHRSSSARATSATSSSCRTAMSSRAWPS